MSERLILASASPRRSGLLDELGGVALLKQDQAENRRPLGEHGEFERFAFLSLIQKAFGFFRNGHDRRSSE